MALIAHISKQKLSRTWAEDTSAHEGTLSWGLPNTDIPTTVPQPGEPWWQAVPNMMGKKPWMPEREALCKPLPLSRRLCADSYSHLGARRTETWVCILVFAFQIMHLKQEFEDSIKWKAFYHLLQPHSYQVPAMKLFHLTFHACTQRFSKKHLEIWCLTAPLALRILIPHTGGFDFKIIAPYYYHILEDFIAGLMMFMWIFCYLLRTTGQH